MCVTIAYFPVVELLDAALEEEGGTLIARKVGEAVQNTLGAVVGAIDIPLGENDYNTTDALNRNNRSSQLLLNSGIKNISKASDCCNVSD